MAKLRELILTLAVQGKLVPQDPADEPASVLLRKIRAEKDRLLAEGKIKKDKPLAAVADEEKPFGLPEGWEWVRALDICALITCRVPDDWLLKNKRPLLHGREVLQAVLATWQSRAKELPC